MFSKALEIRISIVGEDHPDVAAIHVNMGIVYQTQAKHEEVLVEMMKGLDVLVSVHGNEH